MYKLLFRKSVAIEEIFSNYVYHISHLGGSTQRTTPLFSINIVLCELIRIGTRKTISCVNVNSVVGGVNMHRVST